MARYTLAEYAGEGLLPICREEAVADNIESDPRDVESLAVRQTFGVHPLTASDPNWTWPRHRLCQCQRCSHVRGTLGTRVDSVDITRDNHGASTWKHAT